MKITDYSFTEFINWARGYVLIEIGKGNFKDAIGMVVNQTIEWAERQKEKDKKGQ